MILQYIEIHQLRNLRETKLELGAQFNIFYGLNGSGKTSFLEAVHYLGFGKSFRTRHNSRVVHHSADRFALFGRVQQEGLSIGVGVERLKNGEGQIRIQGENIASAVELTKLLPLQIIHPASHRLLTDGPKLRRQLMDLGVFHVEHAFLSQWQRANRALKQRNAALKQRCSIEQITLWDGELTAAAEALDAMRKTYLLELEVVFFDILRKLIQLDGLSIRYMRGWSSEQSLGDILAQSLSRDMYLGYTQYGPHRADIDFRVDSVPVQDGLSQGQQKLILYALRLAQGVLLQKHSGNPCLFLIDDLPAELDCEKRAHIIAVLEDLQAQVIITGAERQELMDLAPSKGTKMFHVERGSVIPVV